MDDDHLRPLRLGQRERLIDRPGRDDLPPGGAERLRHGLARRIVQIDEEKRAGLSHAQ